MRIFDSKRDRTQLIIKAGYRGWGNLRGLLCLLINSFLNVKILKLEWFFQFWENNILIRIVSFSHTACFYSLIQFDNIRKHSKNSFSNFFSKITFSLRSALGVQLWNMFDLEISYGLSNNPRNSNTVSIVIKLLEMIFVKTGYFWGKSPEFRN